MNEVDLFQTHFCLLDRPGDRYDIVAKMNIDCGEFRITGIHLCINRQDGTRFVQIPGKTESRAISLRGDSPLRQAILELALEAYDG